MKLTPLDIRHKEFKRGMRGYADVEVDEFLDAVADEYERIFKENIDLQERVETLEEKVAGYVRIEDTLQKTLVNAQANAEEQKQNANKQAQLILQDAELKARQLVNEAYTERGAVEQSTAKLRSAEEDFRFKFRQLLDGFLRQIQETPDVTDAPGAATTTDFSRHAEAIKEAIARESAPPRGETSAGPKTSAPAGGVRPEQPTPAPLADVQIRRRDDSEARAHRHVVDDIASSGDTAGDVDVTAERRVPAQADTEGRTSPATTDESTRGGNAEDLLADVDTEVNENEFKW